MTKESSMHFLIEKSLKKKLIKEAKSAKISLGELCRRKLSEDLQLNRIEGKLDILIKYP